MAISPPSDIVLDVARAVEPEALEAARARLASRGAAAGPSEAFSVGDLRSSGLADAAAAAEATPETYRKFEAMVLSTFVQSMLPKGAGAVYGEGLSGDMWKSLLSQQLGTVIADRGGIGIADRLLKDHYYEGDTKVAMSGVSGGPDKARLDQEHSLSAALVQEMQRRLTSDITGEASPPAASR
ncbi:rod-binding protein [Mesorhizobium sp. BAC0120]|uniref:rod-binding protein n=1 Tax=Mesorhizobium sp. BAC0120 TaxID=3090670 RepID=UPI00298BCACC|nr:rod-binding protein [Mesorhizobium sp. BAC0120]MDW6024417.1 rod-binding protein [Mesorhizobium sp. BAC0120]